MNDPSLETQIAEWRTFVTTGAAVNGQDVEELEDHLRQQIGDLSAAGLADDEAFLVAVKRMGDLDSLSREFAREHSGRLWKQLVLSDDETTSGLAPGWVPALAFAVAAALVVQFARLTTEAPLDGAAWLANNPLLVLSLLAAYFAFCRRLAPRMWLLGAVPFVAAALLVNLYPFDADSVTQDLVALHLPVVLWFAVAYPYASGAIGSHDRRMDFVRFTGEWAIYYALIALGGGVLMALTVGILEPTGVDVDRVAEWVLPSGAAGAVIVAAWLVESKQRVIENMAPVLTMLFTPLFAVMLTCATVVYAVSEVGEPFDRELLLVFDALLVVVLALILYGLSAREGSTTPSWMDRIGLVVLAAALVLDVMVLGSMLVRVGDLGLTPNRVAALGLNLVLLVNLLGAAVLSARFLAGRSTFHRLERWQMAYLPVFAVWTGAVVVLLPPLFGFG